MRRARAGLKDPRRPIGVFFFVRETAAQPRIGDHIHAAMDIYVCGQHEPKLPQFEAGIHSHGDGLMHMHPQVSGEEGAGPDRPDVVAH